MKRVGAIIMKCKVYGQLVDDKENPIFGIQLKAIADMIHFLLIIILLERLQRIKTVNLK